MKTKPELLAPAGNMESLKTAVRAGADAVYFGMGALNARASAQNFDREEVREAIDLCHAWGVKTHLTLNTLLLDREMQRALDTAAWLYECGADALIVQDMGLIALLRKQLPDMALHGSTQMSIVNEDGVLALEKLGFERAVLGRECSLEDIERIKAKSGLDLEVFVHGAMCVSVSGQCLHSSMLGGRSGNRGGCAQPCRMEHSCGGKSGYLLSMQDQCQLENLPRLAEIGVASLKIEGRMKSPDYVGSVVSAYRKALDLWVEGVSCEDYDGFCRSSMEALAKAYSRNGGFSSGYSHGREALIDDRNPSYGQPQKLDCERGDKRPLTMRFMLLAGRPAALSLQWKDFRVMAYGEIPQGAEKAALDEGRIRASLTKLGETPYACGRLEIMMDQGLFLSTSALNALRRQATNALQQKVAESFRRTPRSPRIQFAKGGNEQPGQLPLVTASVQNHGQASAAVGAGVELLILGVTDWRSDTWHFWRQWMEKEKRRRGKLPPIWLELPSVSLPWGAEEVKARLVQESVYFHGLVLTNLGHLTWTKGLNLPLRGGWALNATNTISAANYKMQGLDSLLLSPELNAAQMQDIMVRVPGCGLLVYGKIPTMQLRHCPHREQGGACGQCGEGLEYMDRKGERFILTATRFGMDDAHREDCVWQLYNSRAQDLMRMPDKLRGLAASEWRLQFVDEGEALVKERIEAYRSLRYGSVPQALEDSTSGHFKRGWAAAGEAQGKK